MEGKLIIISAPSGSGKTTIVNYLLSREMNLTFSVSATSRQPRPGEEDGKNYFFLTKEEFKKKVNKGEFLEWEEVYEGICYGTLKSEVDKMRRNGKNIIFDVDVVGGLNIKKIYGEEALAIFIQPPSVKELRKRLQNRSTETSDKIDMRVNKAQKEMMFAGRFDAVVINDKLETALIEAEKLVRDFISHS